VERISSADTRNKAVRQMTDKNRESGCIKLQGISETTNTNERISLPRKQVVNQVERFPVSTIICTDVEVVTDCQL
jgi:hypothetical protein